MAFIPFRIICRFLSVVLIGLGASACVKLGQPPVIERSPVFAQQPNTYQVHLGDTLYSIAWRFDLDFRTLARINGLHAPYVIQPGQRLRLSGGARASHSRTARAPIEAKPRPPFDPSPVRVPRTLRWRWPTDAPVSREYEKGNSGMDFSLSSVHNVRAAATGTVVYSGNGLGGYRHLTIIKHSERYLSAYSFNQPPAVSEGDSIKAGGLVADIQDRGRSVQTLHFEIRKEGEPVSPRAVIR